MLITYDTLSTCIFIEKIKTLIKNQYVSVAFVFIIFWGERSQNIISK